MSSKSIATVILSIAIIVGLGFVAYKQKSHIAPREDACASINPDDVTKEAQLIDNSKTQYATTSKQVLGRSTDGGVQIDYFKDGKILLAEVGLFGETVNYKASYFVRNDKVYYFHEEVDRYERSVYAEDFSSSSKSIEIKDYYFDGNQKLCSWFINQESQPIDEKVKAYVNEAIVQLKIDK
jgi:hypothetical protein